MIFKKAVKEVFILNNENGNGDLNISPGSDVEKQLKMIGLTKTDLQIINALQPFVIEKIDIIVEYDFIRILKMSLLC